MIARRSLLQGLAAASLPWAAAGPRDAWGAEDDKAPMTILLGVGASMDFTARLIADQLHDALGRNAIVVGRPGAGQRLALGELRRASPDGRTIGFATDGPFSIYPNIFTRLEYDPERDFTPIAGICSFEVALSTGPATGAGDMKQLLAWARAQKTNPLFGSVPGNGSLSHFVGISIDLAAHLGMSHVPYKESGSALADLATGRLPMLITAVQPQVEMHKAGKIRLLAVSGDRRSLLVPEVPTLKEAGIDVSSTTRAGLFGPARLPPELVARLHAAVQPMFADAAIKDKLAQQGMTPWPASAAEFSASLAQQRQHFAALVKASGYVPEAS